MDSGSRNDHQVAQQHLKRNNSGSGMINWHKRSIHEGMLSSSANNSKLLGAGGASFQKPPILSGVISQNQGAQGGGGGSLHLRRASQNTSGSRSAMANGADGGSKKNSLSGFGHSHSMENVVFFDGNMLEALGKQVNQGSLLGSAKNQVKDLSRDSTLGKLPSLEQGKPPAGPSTLLKSSTSELPPPFLAMQKKVQVGGSATDVYTEANDIIEEFKREEEIAINGGNLKYLVKRHSAAVANLGLQVPIGSKGATKHNNFALQTGATMISRSMSQHDSPQKEGKRLEVNAQDFVKENTIDKEGFEASPQISENSQGENQSNLNPLAEPTAQDIPNRDSLRSRQEQRPGRQKTQSTDHSRGAIIAQQPVNNVNQPKDQIFLASSLASLLQDVEDELQSNKVKRNSKKGGRYQNNGPINKQPSNKMLLSSQNSGVNSKQQQKQGLKNKLRQSSSLESILMNRPKALAQGAEEDSRGIPMMVIVGSPDIKGHKTQQDHKDDEAVVRIHQLERTGQASWDHNDAADNDQLADEPSLSMIVRQRGGPMNTYLQREDVEGSVLFSPRAVKRGGMGVSMIEEAVILETLKICKGLSPGGPEERLFAEPSEEINTQILFQDHLVNNFYYHERMFTHRNINQFYQNGQLNFNVPITQTMTTNQYNETEGNNQAANAILIGGGSDPKQSLNQRSTSGFRPIFSSQSNMLTPNEAAKFLKQAGSGSGIQPSIQTVLTTGGMTQQNVLPRMTAQTKQEKFAQNKQRPPILQLTTHNSALQVNSGSIVIPGPFVPGSTNLATVLSSHKRLSNHMVTQANTGQLAHQPTQANQILIQNLSMETDNTDLNDEFVMPDNTPPLGDVINTSQQDNGELLLSEPPSMNRSLLFDFSIEDDNVRDSKDSSTQSLSIRVQDALRTAPPFSVIKLPSHAHIQISGVHLRHPLSIIGRPGTIIEIQSGNIVVDFREFLKANPGYASDPHRLKVIISETSLIFKYDLSQVIERIRFIQEQMKTNNNQGRKGAPMSLDDMRWSLDFSEGSIGGPFGVQEADYGLSYVTFLPENPQTVRFPMLIVEEQSCLDVRDCYMRSIRRDHNQPISQDDTLEIATQKIKKSFECEEIGVFTEPRSWNQRGQFDSNQILNSCLPRVKRAQVFLRSCIFFNFFDQVRVSIDTYCMMEKCHMSEARNNSVSAINPRCLKVLGSNFSKPSRHCINAEWLKSSTNTEKCRIIHIEGCDIYSSGGTSILVQSLQDFPSENTSQFSVHNLKINILNNQITRSRGDGLTILNLALTTIDISSNEFNQNQMHHIYIKQVHQKSNKTATRNFSYLSIKDNKLQQSERGAGCWIVDSGFTFERCQFRGNRLGGMIISGGTPQTQNSQLQLNIPQQRLTPTNRAVSNSQEVEQRLTAFLRKYPMATKIVECEFSLNYSHGCWIDEHWKGPVSISQCRFSYNQESGLTVKADKFPKQILFEHPTVIILDKKFKGSPRHMSKRNRIIPITKRSSSTQKLSLLSDIKKENQRYECSLGNLPAGTFHINECDFVENKHNGLNISSVVTAVTFTTFVGNNGYAIRLQNAEQKQLLRLEYTNEKDYKRSVVGFVGGSWGLVNYQDAQKQKPPAQGFSILACCSAKQSRGNRNSTNGGDSITTSLSILKNPNKQALPIRDSKQRFDLQADNMKKLMEKDSENGGEGFGEEAPNKKKKRFFFF